MARIHTKWFLQSLLPRFVLLSFLFVPGLLHDELHKPRVNWRGSHDSRYVNVGRTPMTSGAPKRNGNTNIAGRRCRQLDL